MGRDKITAITAVTMMIHTYIYLEDTELVLYAPLHSWKSGLKSKSTNQKLYFHQK